MKNFMCLSFALFLLSCSTDANNEMNPKMDRTGTGIPEANTKDVGDSAADMLSADTYTSLYVELFYVEGLEPDATTISNFESFLSDRLNKPGTIEIQVRPLDSPGQEQYSISDIRALEDQIRTAYTSDDRVAVYGLFIDGEYDQNSENSSVLGVAYRNTSFAIFGETLRQFSGNPLAPARHVLETAVLHHEFGHLLGLVNAGSPMQEEHQDTAHGRHCTMEDCLMYYTAETGEGLLNLITGGTVPSLDGQCLADLRANGGK